MECVHLLDSRVLAFIGYSPRVPWWHEKLDSTSCRAAITVPLHMLHACHDTPVLCPDRGCLGQQAPR